MDPTKGVPPVLVRDRADRGLKAGPKPFTLLGEKIVLWLDENGEPACLQDRCCHRTAKLSKGWCDNGHLVCGYHGWTYDRDGTLVRIPQFSPDQIVPRLGVRPITAPSATAMPGCVSTSRWRRIPDVPEDRMTGYRRIQQFHDVWNTAPLRLMENSFDNAHFAFVHKGTFGQIAQPKPEKYESGRPTTASTPNRSSIANPPMAHRITGTTAPETKRHMRNTWFMPFCRRLDIEYPVRAAPHHLQLRNADRRWLDQARADSLRNDRRRIAPPQELIDWDAVIIEEDRDILESTDPDAPRST